MELRHPSDLVLSDDVDPLRDHIRGSEDAPVTLVEYGDYECPYCGEAEFVVRRLLRVFGEGLRHVWRHLPLSDIHPYAQMAAEAAEAASAQGAFWKMHNRLIGNQRQLELHDLERYARELGLDLGRVREALDRHAFAKRVAEDVASAEASGAQGTPTFFINGKRHVGDYDLSTLTTAVHEALTSG